VAHGERKLLSNITDEDIPAPGKRFAMQQHAIKVNKLTATPLSDLSNQISGF
jgi:hypothetical protein